jgi:predicted DNA-binding transcriptional regulator YafY
MGDCMPKTKTLDKMLLILELLGRYRNGITTDDIQDYIKEKMHLESYSKRAAQKDMESLEQIEALYMPGLFEFSKKGKNKLAKYIGGSVGIDAVVKAYEQKYVYEILKENILSDEHKKKIEDYYFDYGIFRMLGFNIQKHFPGEGILRAISQAIKNQNPISFCYTRNNKKRVVEYFKPYRVVMVDDGWYLLGRKKDNQYRLFILDYIKDVKILKNEVFESPDYEYIDKMISHSKTIWHITHPKVKIKAKIASIISLKILEMEEKGVYYFSNQKIIKKNSDGSLVVEFEAADDSDLQIDFKKQVYPWLPDIEIISPRRYVDFMKKDLCG